MDKKIFAITFCFLSCCFLTSGIAVAQTENAYQEYINRAKSAESSGLWVQASDEYMQAGRLFLEEADKSILSKTVYAHLKSAKDCYNKAAAYYHQKYRLREEDDARQRMAGVDMMIALKGLEGLDYNDKKVEEDNKDVAEDKNQLAYQKGGDVIFAAHKTTFVFNPPKAMKYTAVREQGSSFPKQQPVLFNMFGMVDGIRIQLQEYEDDDKDGTGVSTEMCEKGLKMQKEAEINASPQEKLLNQLTGAGKTTYHNLQLDFGKVCLITKETTQMDTRKKMFSFDMYFYYNRSSYHFFGIAPIEWKNSFMTAIKTFRVVNAKNPEDTKCSNGGHQLLEDKAFYTNYYLPDPSGKVTVTISPVLQRNKVPSAWHKIISATKTMVGQIKEREISLESASSEMTDDAEKIIFYLNQFGFEALSPQKVADAYLEAFDKIVYGIEGLEAGITNMSVNFSFSVPFIEITTKCIPRIICMNNKWQADYENLNYQKVSERKTVEKYSREFMTMRQVQHVQENQLKNFLVKLENDKKNYESAANCTQNIFELRNIDFGVMPDECRLREAKLASLKNEEVQLKEEKIYYENGLANYKKGKLVKQTAVKNALIEIDKRIAAKNIEIQSAQASKKRYESNPDKENPGRIELIIGELDEKIDVLRENIRDLDRSKKEYVTEQNNLSANKYENEIQLKINSLNTRLQKLKTEISAAEKLVAACKISK